MTIRPTPEKARTFLSYIQTAIVTLIANNMKAGLNDAEFSLTGSDLMISEALRGSEKLPHNLTSRMASEEYMRHFYEGVDGSIGELPYWVARYGASDYLTHKVLGKEEQFIWLVETMALVCFANNRRRDLNGSEPDKYSLDTLYQIREAAEKTIPYLPMSPKDCFLKNAYQIFYQYKLVKR